MNSICCNLHPTYTLHMVGNNIANVFHTHTHSRVIQKFVIQRSIVRTMLEEHWTKWHGFFLGRNITFLFFLNGFRSLKNFAEQEYEKVYLLNINLIVFWFCMRSAFFLRFIHIILYSNTQYNIDKYFSGVNMALFEISNPPKRRWDLLSCVSHNIHMKKKNYFLFIDTDRMCRWKKFSIIWNTTWDLKYEFEFRYIEIREINLKLYEMDMKMEMRMCEWVGGLKSYKL